MRRRRFDISVTIPQPLADVLAWWGDSTLRNIRPLSPDQEAIALGLIETIRSIEQKSRFDRIDEWTRGVLCDALREDGVLPGKPPP